jgi:hypothetical protein
MDKKVEWFPVKILFDLLLQVNLLCPKIKLTDEKSPINVMGQRNDPYITTSLDLSERGD